MFDSNHQISVINRGMPDSKSHHFIEIGNFVSRLKSEIHNFNHMRSFTFVYICI